MIQLFFFCIALGAGVYGALSGNLLSLMTATVATLLAASNLFGRLSDQVAWQQGLAETVQRYRWLFLTAGSVLLASLAVREFFLDQFAFSSGYLWLAGIVLVLLAGAVHDRALQQELRITDQPDAIRLPSVQWRTFDRLDWVAIVGLTGLALALRLYQLNDFLPTMHGDEGEMGMLALLALHGPASGISPTPLPLFSTAFLDHPTLFHYLQAAAMWLFGESLTGLRTLSALFGALCVPVVYAIGRIGWGRVAAIAAGWLLAVSHFHLHYSRIALNNIETVWFMAFLVLMMLIARQRTYRLPVPGEDVAGGKPQRSRLIAPLLPYGWAGLAIGLSQYFYYGSRLLPVVAVALVLILLLQRKVSIAQLFMLVIAVVVSYAPLAAHYSRNLPAFLNRTQGVSIFNPEGMAHTLGPEAVWPDDLPRLVWEQVRRNASLFARGGDKSAFYMAELPAFDPLTVILFWLGLGVLLARGYRFPELAILAWFGLGVFLAGVATSDAPYGPRLIVGITSIYLIGGIVLQRLFNVARWIWPRSGPWGAVILALLLGAFTFQSNYTSYFVTYAQAKPHSMPIQMATEIHALGNGYQYYLFGAPHFYADYSTIRFIARGTERYNVMELDELPTLEQTKTAKQGVVVIFLPHRLDLIQAVEARLPGGIVEDHYNAVQTLMYVTYRLPSKETQRVEVPRQSSQSPLPPP